jgi:hypothetical protein
MRQESTIAQWELLPHLGPSHKDKHRLMQAASIPIFFHCQRHKDEPISEQARIALPVCDPSDRMGPRCMTPPPSVTEHTDGG